MTAPTNLAGSTRSAIGIGSRYLTIVSYGDWGQDADYELEQLPGVVLLQKALDKLPA